MHLLKRVELYRSFILLLVSIKVLQLMQTGIIPLESVELQIHRFCW